MYIMKTITATDIKKTFWNELKNIQEEPIIITKRNRNHAVLIWFNEYSHLKELEEHEDILFMLAAKESLKNWFMSQKESQDLIDSI